MATRRSAALVGTLVLALTTLTAGGQTITFTDADAHVTGGASANANFGAAPLVLVSNAGADLSRASKAYIRFNISAIPLPVAGVGGLLDFDDTQMGNTSPNHHYEFQAWGLADGPHDLWSQDSITWNDAPRNDLTSPHGVTGVNFSILGFGVQGRYEHLVQFGGGSGSNLTRWINADTNGFVTMVLVRTTPGDATNDYVHGIRANDSWLQLFPVPEPAAALPFSVCTAALLRRPRRWRRMVHLRQGALHDWACA